MRAVLAPVPDVLGLLQGVDYSFVEVAESVAKLLAALKMEVGGPIRWCDLVLTE